MNLILDYRSRTPFYEQIKEEIVKAIARGELHEGDRLPSLRQLSAELSVNLNTVKRSFDELELQGVVSTVQGKGVFVSDRAAAQAYLAPALATAKTSMQRAKSLGAEKDQLLELVNELYKEEEI